MELVEESHAFCDTLSLGCFQHDRDGERHVVKISIPQWECKHLLSGDALCLNRC